VVRGLAVNAEWECLLQVTGHPSYGLPWGQDRLVPPFLATLAIRQQRKSITFRRAAEMLDTFGMQQGGSRYRCQIVAFQRVFGAQSSSGRTRSSPRHPYFTARASTSCSPGCRTAAIQRAVDTLLDVLGAAIVEETDPESPGSLLSRWPEAIVNAIAARVIEKLAFEVGLSR
jgi:hypothetical protein